MTTSEILLLGLMGSAIILAFPFGYLLGRRHGWEHAIQAARSSDEIVGLAAIIERSDGCRSTHGAAGYALGSVVLQEGGEIRGVRCGACGATVPYVAGRGL